MDIANTVSDKIGFEPSICFFEKARELAGDDVESAQILVDYAKSASVTDISFAEELLLQAIELEPGNWRAHNNLGVVIMMGGGSVQIAREHFQIAVNLSGGDPEALMNLQRLSENKFGPRQ